MSPSSPVKREKNGRIECSVEFPPERVKSAEEEALRSLAASVKIPGFRPGMAPRETLMEKIDLDRLLEETVRILLPDAVESLVKEHEIKTVTSPKISVTKREPLTVSVVFVEQPKVTLKGADRIKIEKKEPKVTDEDAEKMIGYILAKHEKTQEVDRPARDSDRVTLDFWGADAEGKEIAPIRTQGHAVVIGSKTLIPGFEDALKGLKKSDEKSFTVTFPEKYHAEELQGKPVTFHASVKKVEEVTLPELSDEFVKANLGTDTTEEFRKRVKESLIEQENHIERQRRENLLLEEIRKATHVELAPELVAEEEQSLLEDLEEDLKKHNTTIVDWMKSTGKKPEDVEKELVDRAKQRLTLRLGIRELIHSKEITVPDMEMEDTVREMLQSLNEKQRQEFEPAYRKGEKAYEQLLWQKKVEKLFEGMLAK